MIDRRYDLEVLVREPAFKKLAALPLRVLDVLLSHRNGQNGVAWPFQETVAELAGADRTAVSRAIRILKGLKLVAVERRRYRRGWRLYYSFPFLDGHDTGATSAEGSDVTPAPRRNAGSPWPHCQPQRDTGALIDVTPAPHRPKEEPGNEEETPLPPLQQQPAEDDPVTPSDRQLHKSDFAEFWQAVPKRHRQCPVTSRDEFILAVRRGADPAILTARISEYYKSHQGRGEFPNQPKSWLKGGKYDDPAESWKSAEVKSAKARNERLTDYEPRPANIGDAAC